MCCRISGSPLSSFVVEVAESCFNRNLPNVLLELSRIRELGVRVAVDDFGTVSSSLASLSQFPVDEVKIDRSFIARIDGAEDGAALIHVLVELGKALGLRTLAEGIETTSAGLPPPAGAVRRWPGFSARAAAPARGDRGAARRRAAPLSQGPLHSGV